MGQPKPDQTTTDDSDQTPVGQPIPATDDQLDLDELEEELEEAEAEETQAEVDKPVSSENSDTNYLNN